MPVARMGLLLGDPRASARSWSPGCWRATRSTPEVATVVIGDPRILARRPGDAGVGSERGDRPPGRAGGARAGCCAGRRSTPRTRRSARSARVAGKAVLDAFEMALGLAEAGELDAICFAPCNKQAMHEGGLELEDELRFFVQVLGFEGHVGEVNATGELATTRVTSHVPLRAVADLITEDAVLQAIRLAERTLRAAGHRARGSRSRGSTRMPATAASSAARDRGDRARGRAREAEQIAASGPYPSDTVFLRARDGRSTRWSRCTTTRARSR